MLHGRQILIVGKVPPPIGGVTTHVVRLCEWMTYKAEPFCYLDIARSGILGVLRAVSRHRVVHVHGTNPLFLFLVSVWCKLVGTSAILTFHGDVFVVRGIKASLLRMALHHSVVPVLLNEASYEFARVINSNARLMSAFIPPLRYESLTPELLDEIRQRAAGKECTVVTYAYDLAFDNAGREVYGVTEVIEYVNKTDHLLIVSDPSGNYSKFIRERVDSRRLVNVLFISQPHSLCALLALADVFIRNTTTDGDALSVHEALSLGKSVWATDCVPRPLGARTYRTLRDIPVDQLMDRTIVSDYSPPSVVDELVGLYHAI